MVMHRRTPLLLVLAAVTGCGGVAAPEARHTTTVAEASPMTPVPTAARASRPDGRWLTARLTRATILRATPGGRRIARLTPRTEFGSAKVLGVVRRRPGWLQVLTPELANGRRGWIPARSARLGATGVSLHVDRSRRTLAVRRDGRLLRRFPVAVGRPQTPTPLGRYAVTDRLHTGRADSPYGCCALALTGHQTELLPGWPGGDRLAIHATPNPETIGHAVSLGCMRAPTAQMHWMMRHVPPGAPVFVVL
jgi:lipoprotein-anchoring transpeptidase ErfK/SrfK